MKSKLSTLSILLIIMIGHEVLGQNHKTYTADDYDRAAAMLSTNVNKLIDCEIRPQWLPDSRLWYSCKIEDQTEYKMFDPARGKMIKAESTSKLFEKAGAELKAGNRSRYRTKSPDGKYEAFIRDWNLWIKDVSTGEEKALTMDGIENFGYATDNAGWKHSDRAILSWSPDSKKIATFQQDQRHVSNMYLVKTQVGAPELMEWKYPLPADSAIIQIYRVIIHIEGEPRMVRLNMSSDDRRGSLCDDISCEGGFDDISWSEDSKHLVFVSTPRDHKQANVRMADCESGEVREIFEEKVATQFESGERSINWEYLSRTKEIIWYSERSDWGHLYLYDSETGGLKNQITSGDYLVREVLKVDQENRQIYFIGSGREEGVNPYYRYLYRVDFDGGRLTLLTPEKGDHSVRLSPDGLYFIDTYSEADVPPVYEVRDAEGKLIRVLEKADISRLEASGWKAPTPYTVNSASGDWDLYGIMHTPSKLVPGKKYPVIVYIYPGPQGGSVRGWSFRAARGDNQALAELGFVVVALEGSCNPGRSKSFHDACYGDMAENTLPDQISGLKQLNELYDFIDLNRVGIWGHSGGGFATAAAMFRYPDFFKVGISESGNHDNRNYEDDWGERYIGLEVKDENGVSNYEQQANQVHAGNLKGKLMIIHGGMDDNVPPYNTYLVVDALIKAHKDFDMIILPNARHGYGRDGTYIMRRRWDYFVSNLLQAIPPKEYKIQF
jgi:dipeptidyl aminopeptidase/acylaminoacyl peptidase